MTTREALDLVDAIRESHQFGETDELVDGYELNREEAARRILALSHADEEPGLREALVRARKYLPSQSAMPRGKTELGDDIMFIDAALATPAAQSSGAEAKP